MVGTESRKRERHKQKRHTLQRHELTRDTIKKDVPELVIYKKALKKYKNQKLERQIQ